MGAASSGRRRPVASNNALSTLRRWLGMACHRECSITANPHLASSTGVGRVRRISSVCQASAISRRSRSRTCSRSPQVKSRWSCTASWPAMASYFWINVRRATSVGCAVSTSWISSLASCRARASSLCPACFKRASNSGRTRASKGSGCSASRRRINWYCSAMLARLRNWLKARATGSRSSSARSARVELSCSPALRRSALALWRMSSIFCRNASPCCWRMVSPSNSPNTWTSSRRRTSISVIGPLFGAARPRSVQKTARVQECPQAGSHGKPRSGKAN